MAQETTKLELIKWIIEVDDPATIEMLKTIKDSQTTGDDCWPELSDEILEGITQGMEDVEKGRVISREQMKREHGL